MPVCTLRRLKSDPPAPDNGEIWINITEQKIKVFNGIEIVTLNRY